MSPTSGKRSSSRLRETWRSVLSWMHWSRRRQLRRDLEREALLAQIQEMVLFLLREQLWEMALPLADSLTRLDKRQLAAQLQQTEHQQEMLQLLLELLQSTVPPAYQQLGLSSPPQLPPSWVS